MSKKFKAMVLSCMDPRFQPKIFNYLKKRKLSGQYSAFTIAGAAVGVTHSKFKKWHRVFFENLSASIQLHKIDKLIVINHQDCGAAKIANSKKEFNNKVETNIHKVSFKKLKSSLRKKFPKLKIEFNVMALNNSIKKFK
ncbi:carbonic anhydrase [Candidatus Pelagibacter bacterium]|jgi:carbonic anhydrase|nr:carbonic anhydrase [Candidatus Pelagibacter bacterium]MDA9151897.1 carbonic anhydrase [bacterium]MDC0415744.1 carbonic anhydrase [Candidatus Pelagibacter sp.]MDC1133230.1 carbonic anhydrase [Candidatus Pelagibacter sp.]MDC1166201.1 carbonic anhydrase [Candidatus Pelagibacter sp.]